MLYRQQGVTTATIIIRDLFLVERVRANAESTLAGGQTSPYQTSFVYRRGKLATKYTFKHDQHQKAGRVFFGLLLGLVAK